MHLPSLPPSPTPPFLCGGILLSCPRWSQNLSAPASASPVVDLHTRASILVCKEYFHNLKLKHKSYKCKITFLGFGAGCSCCKKKKEKANPGCTTYDVWETGSLLEARWSARIKSHHHLPALQGWLSWIHMVKADCHRWL